MANVLTKILGDPNEREIKRTQALVDQINSFEEQLSKLSDEELKAQTIKFKAFLADGKSLDDLLPEA